MVNGLEIGIPMCGPDQIGRWDRWVPIEQIEWAVSVVLDTEGIFTQA